MKGVVKKITRQAIDREKIISKPMSDKGLTPGTYKEFSKPNKQPNNPIF